MVYVWKFSIPEMLSNRIHPTMSFFALQASIICLHKFSLFVLPISLSCDFSWYFSQQKTLHLANIFFSFSFILFETASWHSYHNLVQVANFRRHNKTPLKLFDMNCNILLNILPWIYLHHCLCYVIISARVSLTFMTFSYSSSRTVPLK